MVNISKTDLAIIAGLAGAADFLAEGRFTAPLARSLKTVIRRGGPAAARFTGATALRAAGTVASVGKTIALRHPVLTGGAIIYYTYQNRDEIANLVGQGYDVIQELPEAIREPFTQPRTIEGLGLPIAFQKRKVSKANKAVKQAMAWLKGGTKASTGAKPGILPKGAFNTAVKAASAANPNTPSKIGKGKSIINKLARRLKQWW